MVILLLGHGANIDAENEKLETPRYIASKKERMWLVQTLKDHAAQKLFEDELSDTENRQMELWNHPGSIIAPLRIRKRKQGPGVSNEAT
ncbi:hypothetical protein MMC27_004674 [Xylographa pallens]|nr:hypothetical protein [Xylographa pallens]